MLKHVRPVVGFVGSAVGSVVGGIFYVPVSRVRTTSAYISTYTIFGVLILIMYLMPTGIVGRASFAARG